MASIRAALALKKNAESVTPVQVLALLTPRENEILDCLLTGDDSVKKMAHRMGVKVGTIRFCMPRLYDKLEIFGVARTNVAVALWAYKARQDQLARAECPLCQPPQKQHL